MAAVVPPTHSRAYLVLSSRVFSLTISWGERCDGYHNRMDFTSRLRQIASKCASGHRTGHLDRANIQIEIGVTWCPQKSTWRLFGVAIRIIPLLMAAPYLKLL